MMTANFTQLHSTKPAQSSFMGATPLGFSAATDCARDFLSRLRDFPRLYTHFDFISLSKYLLFILKYLILIHVTIIYNHHLLPSFNIHLPYFLLSDLHITNQL